MIIAVKGGMTEVEVKGERDVYWLLRELESGETYTVGAPCFEIDGECVQSELTNIRAKQSIALKNGCHQFEVEAQFASHSYLRIILTFRIAADNPIIRFRYTLASDKECHLTKKTGEDATIYFSGFAKGRTKEVRFSEFNELIHSFTMTETEVLQEQFDREQSVMGPLLFSCSDNKSSLIAYEHGSQYPDAYVAFTLGDHHSVRVRAVKGNYYDGELISPDQSYDTLWFQIGMITGSEDQLAAYYRKFVLSYMSLSPESRKPYLYYNTWNYQERNKNWNNKPYLDSMNFERMSMEIDRAHELGIEVFVIDSGWYEATGDWKVNTTFFPDKLSLIKQKLDGYGMKLGLWFDPKAASSSSSMLARNLRNRQSFNGEIYPPHSIWETEESSQMCLVSDYADDFAEELIRLYKELGVSNFKWDAINQYGCNDPGHHHGDESCSLEERHQNYAFKLPLYLARIVDKLTLVCPDAIVDFDVTEGYRCVGLSFLSAGRYSLVNNGPYFMTYDIPTDRDIHYNNANLFFYPGPARGWICRSILTYDKWIPSLLFLGHYLPDDPQPSQLINIASLILGQNGIWGDLPAISDEGVTFIAGLLSLFKQVRADITQSTIRRTGVPGGNPEIYEKINEATGRGVVVAFANSFGQPFNIARETKYTYNTSNSVNPHVYFSEGVSINIDQTGKAELQFIFDQPGAKIVFFGINEVESTQYRK